jgi:hypothetical protein
VALYEYELSSESEDESSEDEEDEEPTSITSSLSSLLHRLLFLLSIKVFKFLTKEFERGKSLRRNREFILI